jgi:hypothetical protein
MRRVVTRVFSATVLAGLILTLSACGDKGSSVPKTGATLEGSVHYGDELIEFALVIVTSKTTSESANIGDDGKYRITNVPLGEVTVAVNTPAGKGDFMSKSMPGAYKGPKEKLGKKTALKYTDVPKQYHDPGTTPLKTTIVAGPNTYDIKIPK